MQGRLCVMNLIDSSSKDVLISVLMSGWCYADKWFLSLVSSLTMGAISSSEKESWCRELIHLSCGYMSSLSNSLSLIMLKLFLCHIRWKKIIEPNGDAKIAADRDFLTMYFFTCQFDILSRFIGLKKKVWQTSHWRQPHNKFHWSAKYIALSQL